MYGYDTALDARFDRIEEAMDWAGHGHALTMLISYAGYNAELFDWLERDTTLTPKTTTRRTSTNDLAHH